jgi:L-fuconolactonase
MTMIIDTHVHVWDLNRAEYPWLQGDTSILNRTWNIEQLDTERKQAGITAGVLVQASGNAEDTNLMLETAYKTDWISGVVCWLPLMDPAATQRMLEERYLKEKYFKGVRHQVHDEKNTKWLLQPAVIESLQMIAAHDVPYDIVGILPAHIETALAVAEKIPKLRMVFDHLNWPPIPAKARLNPARPPLPVPVQAGVPVRTGMTRSDGDTVGQEKFGKWGELMRIAAQHKNFYAKISGLGTASGNFQNRKADDIRPYIEFALEHFGIDHCFCGGDWPVSILADSYINTWQTYKDILQELLSEDEQEKVFYSNAKQFYNLQIS